MDGNFLGHDMSKIKDLPYEIRPREKASRYGIDSLSDNELLAIIIGSGTKDNNVIELSNSLITDFGGLANLTHAKIQDLTKYKGIGKVKATYLLTIFTFAKRIKTNQIVSPKGVCNFLELVSSYQAKIGDKEDEYLAIVVLNRNRIIKYEKILCIGGSNKVSVTNRDIIKEVFIHDGYSFYLFHNHPSENPTPSEEDIVMTTLISRQAKRAKIQLIDHIIVTKNNYAIIEKK